MGRRLLSHLLITLAIFSLTATFFIWVVDATVLNPTKLTKALQDGGVPSALATIIPEKAIEEGGKEDNNCQPQNNQPNAPQNGGCEQQAETEQDKQEKADMKAKIASVVTTEYVSTKIQAAATSVIGYMKNGSPSPVIDISDFPERLRASGVETGEDIDKNFADPIDLNKDGALKSLPDAYSKFKLAKYIGAALFVILLVAEWFVAAKGDKLHRIGRIFLHGAVWYTLFWLSLVVVPSRALPSLKDKVAGDASENALIEAAVKAIQNLFSAYLLGFAIACWVLALGLYLARHGRKHVTSIQNTPAAKGKAKSIPNKR